MGGLLTFPSETVISSSSPSSLLERLHVGLSPMFLKSQGRNGAADALVEYWMEIQWEKILA